MLRTCYKPVGRIAAARQLLAAIACTMTIPSAAHATGFIETGDFSDNPLKPTILGELTPGLNLLEGKIDTYGDRVGPHGERTHQDMDYVTFTVPTGLELTNFIVNAGTSIVTSPRSDLMFLGLAAGNTVNVSPSFDSAAGLLGWTLVSQSELGADILPAIGKATYPGFPVPGATGFTGPLVAGTYSLWLFDGDEAATYDFKLLAAAVPEPASWAMMIAGFGAIGFALRRRPRVRAATSYA